MLTVLMADGIRNMAIGSDPKISFLTLMQNLYPDGMSGEKIQKMKNPFHGEEESSGKILTGKMTASWRFLWRI